MDSALQLAYRVDGTPAFVGQAIVVESCGGGGFCHSPDIPAEDRFGAPAGLEFDLRLASTGIEIEAPQVDRLAVSQQQLLARPGALLQSIDSGAMPPPGAAGADYFDRVEHNFARPTDGGFEPLPPIASDEGRAILRSWVACGAPVVERTRERIDGRPNKVGFTVAACPRECVAPTWPSIHALFAGPPDSRSPGRCASSACHAGAGAAAELDLSASLASSHAALLAAPLEGGRCDGSARALVVPGEPDASLLWRKLTARSVVCGGAMPPSGGRLGAQAECAIRAWIACGACEDPADARCSRCAGEAMEECDYDAAMEGGCAMAIECAEALDLEP